MRLLFLALSLGALLGCDSFFEARGRVVRCGDDVPIVGASVRATLIAGVGEEPLLVETDGEGRFSFMLNEPPSARVRLQVEADGYEPVTLDVGGGAGRGSALSMCMNPVARDSRSGTPPRSAR
ncbi:MAG: carboxypeptidase regulatory-like domain-containing protein [Myxococcales bacterium]|nr:carboxypeptidase regulatory-like domain-containing protein [Myxococcales bacterium]